MELFSVSKTTTKREMKEIIGTVFPLLLIVFLFSLFLAIPTYLLWNLLMPAIFGVKNITLLQALGINLLSGILFKVKSNEGK